MRTEDGYIITKCLNGEPEAFGFLMDKYKGSVYAFAYSKLHNFHDAEDVTQEVFIKAYQKLRSLRRWDNFLAWLYAIASNMCKNWTRSKANRPDSELVEDQNAEVLTQPSLNSYHEGEISEMLHEALDSLPETQRQVLILHYLGGMKGKEIAKFLGISPGAVWERLSRARAQLREEMLGRMSATFETQRLQAGFTIRMVEMVKRMRIHPMPRMTGLPWGLSLAAGIIVTVLCINPYLNIPGDIAIPTGSPLPAETRVLKTGEVPVDILNISPIQVISSDQGDGNIGGFELPDQQNALFTAPQAAEGRWAGKAEMPTARFGACSAVVDGRIYVIGGGKEIGGKVFSTVEEYDPATDTWERKADMPETKGGCSASASNGKIYVVGGGDRGISGPIVEEYDVATDTWETKADMPTARSALSTEVVNGKIYAIGGLVILAPRSVLSVVEEYDPATDTWTKKADMPTARHGAGSGVVDGKIYVIGGWAGNALSSVVEEYDPVTDTWSRKAPMPTRRDFFSTCEVDGKIYAIGGQDTTGVLSIVEVYDPATDTWTTEPSMPTARMYLTADVVNGKIYAIGGTTQQLNPNMVGAVVPVTGTVEEYDTESAPSTQGKSVEVTGKATAMWGEIKSD